MQENEMNNTQEPEVDMNQLLKVRREKLQELQEAGKIRLILQNLTEHIQART